MKECKIIFDISKLVDYLIYNSHYTGIQRVLVMILDEFVKSGRSNVWVCFLQPSSKKYLTLCLGDVKFSNWSDPIETKDFLKKSGIILNNRLLAKYRGKFFKYYFHRTRLDLIALVRNHKYFAKRGMTIKDWSNNRTASRINCLIKNLGDVANLNDQLLLFDATWKQEYIDHYKILKEKGLNIYTCVYDLIPIYCPEVAVIGITSYFYRWLAQSVEYTTSYIAISNNTKKDLRKFLHSINYDIPIQSIPLVQINVNSFAKSPINPPKIDKNLIQLPKYLDDIVNVSHVCKSVLGEPFVLHVGTIEIRKNIWRLALAWKKLLEQGYYDLPRLVIVGREGWLNDRFWDLMRSTANIYGYVTIISNANDAELDLLYRNCLFAAMVSTYEGWGLPVGEALSYGKTAVVADNSSLREVGMDLVEYCDGLSVESIASSIKKLVLEPEYRNKLELKIRDSNLRNWTDVAQDLLNFLNIRH